MRIEIQDIELETIIGILPEERHKSQKLIANLCVEYQAQDVVAGDCLEGAVDYRQLVAIVEEQAKRQFHMLESLSQGIIDELLHKFPHLSFVEISLEKPQALKNGRAKVVNRWKSEESGG